VPQGWTPDQIKQFQDYWDTEFAGDLAKRRRAKFVPGETAAKVVQTKEPQHKDDFDEWLARIICFAFSVPPQWATKVMNRATAGNHSAQSEEEGLEPTKEWVKDLIDEIVAEEFASPDLELHWLQEDEADPETVLEGRVKLGAVTLNEMRDALGLDPFDNAAADRPMVLTRSGYVPIEANASGEGASTSANGGDVKPHAAVVQKYSPDQPRVPAGNPDGGQWPSDGGNGSSTDSSDAAGVGSESPKRYAALDTGTLTDETKGGGSTALAATDSSDDRVELAQLEVTPKGFSISRPPGGDPLDPKGLNGPILPDEQQKVADALTLILNQDFSTLYPHVYQNYPHPRTGAVLPSSAVGYIVFDVPGLGTGRGVRRLVIDAGTGAIYYTNNHYLSFYPLKLNPRGE
jgi:guanyl-specific ribonuclease Sa